MYVGFIKIAFPASVGAPYLWRLKQINLSETNRTLKCEIFNGAN